MDLPKLLNADQIKAWDQHTMTQEPITSLDLMERAATAFTELFVERYDNSHKVAVCIGPGNNGGDGAVISRLLLAKGYEVTSWTFREGKSEDCQTNLDRLGTYNIIDSHSALDLRGIDVIIDALFGIGLSRRLDGKYQELVDRINATPCKVVSVDIPSGMYSDKAHPSYASAISADWVISFQVPKRAFFFPESDPYIEEWTVCDIGLDQDFLKHQWDTDGIIDHHCQVLLPKRRRFSHKGTYGHVLIIAGSSAYVGAGVLATGGCLRSGVGLTTVMADDSFRPSLSTNCPEAMMTTQTLEAVDISRFSAITIGPGLGRDTTAVAKLDKLLSLESLPPLVIDADALNIISAESWLSRLPAKSILTPHPKEFERLVGKWHNSDERLEKQRSLSKSHQIIIVLKDAHTIITDTDGKAYFNTSGNPGMATGGSGDVLCGIIVGLRAQGINAIESGVLGVYYHGVAGDKAAHRYGQYSMKAWDIIDHLAIGEG